MKSINQTHTTGRITWTQINEQIFHPIVIQNGHLLELRFNFRIQYCCIVENFIRFKANCRWKYCVCVKKMKFNIIIFLNSVNSINTACALQIFPLELTWTESVGATRRLRKFSIWPQIDSWCRATWCSPDIIPDHMPVGKSTVKMLCIFVKILKLKTAELLLILYWCFVGISCDNRFSL